MKPLVALLALTLVPLPAQRTLPSRAELAAVEQIMTMRLRRSNPDRPMDLLGLPRGVYLEGYGAVFSAELSLILTPGISPFRPEYTKAEIEKIRAAKQQQLPLLKKTMQELLVDSAATLDRVPASEQVVFGVVFFYHNWEDRTGLPQMITMQARRQELLQAATDPQLRASVGQHVKVREE